jgi:nitric oxide reductase NorQ protein
VSYNPGYHGLHKTLKPSTRQRFVALEFNYPAAEQEAVVVAHEGQVELALARQLVAVAERTRRLKEHGLAEGASTRMLIHAAGLTRKGLSAHMACQQAIACPLSDDPDLTTALAAAVDASFSS